MGPGAAQAWQGQCCPTGTLACAVWENPNSAINKSIWQRQHWEGVTSFFGASRTRSSCGSALLPLCHPGDKDTFMTLHSATFGGSQPLLLGRQELLLQGEASLQTLPWIKHLGPPHQDRTPHAEAATLLMH